MFKLKVLLPLVIINFTNAISSDQLADLDWWQTATIYQIYPQSFKDSNEDGIGDLGGIIDKLDYIADLGITAIWLNPIYKSPKYDGGYDVSDYRDIDPVYGDLKQLKELLDKSHEKGLKVILDFVPNHSSHLHEWFQKSVKGEGKYKDYYVWVDAVNGGPPNNWISVFKYGAWEWSEDRQQYYLHQFLKEQPDFNQTNEDVKQELKDIMNYWLDDFDMDGLRFDAVPFLIEAQNLTDEPLSNDPNATPDDYEYLSHIYTTNTPESYQLVYEWRDHIDTITARKPETKLCITEAIESSDLVIPFYGNKDGSKLGAHFSFNPILFTLNDTSTAEDVLELVDEWLTKLPKIYTSNWVLGNHDNHRVGTKVGAERIDLMNLLAGFLPGIQVTYYGEEIGMVDVPIACEDGVDEAYNCTIYYNTTRDFERTPMQWDNTSLAGFTTGNKTWLPVSNETDKVNVAAQLSDPRSHLNVYKKLQEVRQGLLKEQTEIEYNIFGNDKNGLEIIRFKPNVDEKFLLLLNYGSNKIEYNGLPNSKILVTNGESTKTWGDRIEGNLTLDPYEVIILHTISE